MSVPKPSVEGDVIGPEHATRQDHRNACAHEPEPPDRGDGGPGQLVGKVVGDAPRHCVPGSRDREDDRRQLAEPALREPARVDREGEVERAPQAEVGRDGPLEGGPGTPPVTAAKGGPQRRKPERVAAAPVAGDRPEGREADAADRRGSPRGS